MSVGRSWQILAVGATRGGVGDVFRRVVVELRARGHVVTELELPARRTQAWTGISAAIRARNRLRAAPIVHIEFGNNDIEVFWFALAAVFIRSDCVIVAHDYPKLANDPGSALAPLSSRLGRALGYRVLSPLLDGLLARILLRRAGTVVVLGEEARVGWLKQGARHVETIVHGSDAATSGTPPPSEGESVLCAGFLGPSKGVDTLLEAWTLVHADVGLPLTFAGEPHDPWFFDALRNHTNFPSPPVVLGPIADEAEFQALVGRAAIVVLPYRSSSPASGVLIRAMSAGRPVIATPVPAMRAIVDGVNGVLVPVGDAAALAAAINRLLASPETRDRLGAAAAETAGGSFTWDAHVAGLEAIYQHKGAA